VILDISKLDRAAVLAALYNRAKPQGMGFLHYDPNPMTPEEAAGLLDAGQTYFDYVKGRVMKVDLSGGTLDNRLYDRDNGHGAALAALDAANLYATEKL
jgi:hypothetical protein